MGLIGLGKRLASALNLFKFCQKRDKLSKEEMDSQIIIDEVVVIEKSKLAYEKATHAYPYLDEQYLGIVHTELSPPTHQREIHEPLLPFNMERSTRECTQPFSLSPPPIELEEHSRPVTPASLISHMSSRRSPTPCQASIGQIWRGPTPPWTMNKY